MEKKFEKEIANFENPKWSNMIYREKELYKREDEWRSEFGRDYSRILFSNSYRRLKSKTQVFYSPSDDHICTRLEHVNNVESISYTIAHSLGLNTELTKAISVAHDLGHSPFGHKGEKILNKISEKVIGTSFWHEQNGVYLVDNIELLEDNEGMKQNLDLTYAVRDGIISHCGEIDENCLKPRDEAIDLYNYTKPNEYAPYTWEGCVVKVSDKISYLGRDIEDAISIGILREEQLDILKPFFKENINKVNNTVIINELVSDLCKNSTPEYGLQFSDKAFELINKIKEFNFENIYNHPKHKPAERYFEYIISEIYDLLISCYEGINTIKNLQELTKSYPTLASRFIEWLENYIAIEDRQRQKLKNKIVYDLSKKEDYAKAIITYIAGMTDNYAIKTYQEIIRF